MLTVHDLHYAYGPTPVLGGVSFSARRGEVCGLFGPNGCGKTTLFRCCLGLLTTHRGSVRVDGRMVTSLRPAERARWLAYVPQEHKPPFPLLVHDVVMLGRTPYVGLMGRASDHDRQIVAGTLVQLGLESLAHRPYDQLSGGQRQLVLIARAVAQQTPVMLLDEPASGLDFQNQLLIWRVLRSLAAAGTAVICCTHDPNHVHWFCDHAVIMQDGMIVAEGPPASALGQTTLQQLYPDTCDLTEADGAPVVLPLDVTNRRVEVRG